MAIAIIAEIPGGNAELDQRVMKEIGGDGRPPRGALLRLAGPMDGGWRIITVWETQEAFETFQREVLRPALQRLGMDRDPATPRVWKLHEMMVTKEAALPR